MSEQQQPVAFRYRHSLGEKWHYGENIRSWWECEPLYTADYAESLRQDLKQTEDCLMFQQRENQSLRQQRDELLSALEECLSAYRYSNRLPETVMQAELKLARIESANNKARATIAKAKEQA